MGYYQTFLEKQERIKKELEEAELEKVREKRRQNYQRLKNMGYYIKNKERQKETAKKYYYNNREYVLERQRVRKYQNSAYYKEWYQNNRIELLTKRDPEYYKEWYQKNKSKNEKVPKQIRNVSSNIKHNVYNNKRLQDVPATFVLFS